ncbi:MAG: serine/threonine protein kinase, partial [Phycisphaerales bacterium]|nr:serine/threonine protein kinase [Phycisphaerales bacterium]
MQAVLQLPESEREAYIRAHCGGDQRIETAVRSSLETMFPDDTAAGILPPKADRTQGEWSAGDEEPTSAGIDDAPGETIDLQPMQELTEGDAAGATLDLPQEGAEVPVQPSASGARATFANIPESVAEFRILKLLGTGGMGSVYLAQQSRPDREVAVKVMKAGLSSDAAMKRFEFEVETLAKLNHQGIAVLYEAGIHEQAAEDAVPYLAMEFVNGARTITDYSRSLALDVRATLELFRRACDGVAFGHARGVIHRDLKPANILVDEDGHPKVIDFGVARATE